jgi:hypothetical protein
MTDLNDRSRQRNDRRPLSEGEHVGAQDGETSVPLTAATSTSWIRRVTSDDSSGANCPNDEVDSVWHATMTELKDLAAKDKATFTSHFWPDLNAALNREPGLGA